MSFKKAAWINNTDVYEVNVRQYTPEGTFNAFAKELPRLQQMGVSTLWFMPITPIAQQNKKGSLGSPYACSDYTAINPEFGTLNDFKKLVKLAQGMGFNVIIDWVANHTGWDHVWTVTNPEYFKRAENGDFKIASGMSDIIELDYQNPALRKAMIDAMEFWVKECDIDGYRCDLAFWVQLDFWMEARAALEKTKTLFWLAESDPLDHPDYYQAFDACYTWTWMHKTEEFYKQGQDKYLLDEVVHRYDTNGGPDAIPLWFTSNHDENTWNGTEYEKYGDAAKALAVFSFTRNGLPLIYSGQELPNYKRLQFFDKDQIDWNGKYELHDFYKTLLTLHKNNTALRAGDAAVTTYNLSMNNGDKVMAYLRKNGQAEVLVLLNFSKEALSCSILDEHLNGKFINVFDKHEEDFTGLKIVELQPWQYLVYEK
ncbi:alpha-amylase family glycosyl hydrolase [Ferruginibacter sp.]|uniref:alpha-amylase family glycosyl hydrolase n=1 Tax=Ferruginibacter sp. TaxID=1940288 RepID=UPI0019BB0593|nr:alpha-amylase family glycosyl hydrolase [Ferruginibacter sp.]MBC7627663.1 alpha amylase C-terminal domain-containing protein [Ferruginibacter sp.]